MIQEMKSNALAKAKSRKGFTLAELLIVVAIIAILIAIAIPLFTKQMESAKKATDDANLRTAKAVAMGVAVDLIDGTAPGVANGDTFDAKKGEFTNVAGDAYVAQTDDAKSGTTGRTKGEVIKIAIDTAAKTAVVDYVAK